VDEWGEGGAALAGRALAVQKQVEEGGQLLVDPALLGEGGSLPKALNVTLFRQCLLRTIDISKGHDNRFEEGELVEANFSGRGKFYPAKVFHVYPSGTYDLSYDDGERELGVEAVMIRAFDSLLRDADHTSAGATTGAAAAAGAAAPTEAWVASPEENPSAGGASRHASNMPPKVCMYGHDLEGARRTYDALMRKAPWHPTLNWG
jgi:hypothetical protein